MYRLVVRECTEHNIFINKTFAKQKNYKHKRVVKFSKSNKSSLHDEIDIRPKMKWSLMISKCGVAEITGWSIKKTWPSQANCN